MKKLFTVVLVILILSSLCGCRQNAPEEKETVSYETMKTAYSKEGIEEFLALLKEWEPGNLTSGYSHDETHCYNVTPIQVAVETSMRIFKFSDSCESFVMLDNEIYPLCASFGGYGFVNAVPCDFDEDGNKDLLVASSWGSGMHRSVISLFHSDSKTSTILYDTSTTDTPGVDLIVNATTPSFSSKEMEDLPIYYEVYTARIETTSDNMADLSYLVTGVAGSIKVLEDVPTFVPYAE